MIYHKIIKPVRENSDLLLMVHGFTHNHTYFENQVEYFREKYQIILVDLRGHGGSSNLPGPYGVEEYADDLEALLNFLDMGQVNYWGTHTGAAVGLVLALRKANYFSSLILEGTFLPGFYMPRTAELIDSTKQLAANMSVKSALSYWFRQADWFDYMRMNQDECRADKHLKLLMDFAGKPFLSLQAPQEVTNVSELLTEINLPCLVYNGQFDLSEFKDAAEHLKRNLNSCKSEVVLHSGGFPAWENPEAVNKLVMDYLSEL